MADELHQRTHPQALKAKADADRLLAEIERENGVFRSLSPISQVATSSARTSISRPTSLLLRTAIAALRRCTETVLKPASYTSPDGSLSQSV